MDEREFQDLMQYQNLLARQVMQEARTDRKIKFLQLANTLTGYGKRPVQTEALIHEAANSGFSEHDAYVFLEELERDGTLTEAKPGFVRRA